MKGYIVMFDLIFPYVEIKNMTNTKIISKLKIDKK